LTGIVDANSTTFTTGSRPQPVFREDPFMAEKILIFGKNT
jgi:hypothetical protein